MIYNLSDIYKTLDSEKNIYVFGAGDLGKRMVGILRDDGRNVAGIFDNNDKLWGKKIRGITVENPKLIKNLTKDSVYIVCNQKYGMDIERQLCGAGINRNNILVFGYKWDIDYLSKSVITEDDAFVYSLPCKNRKVYYKQFFLYQCQNILMKLKLLYRENEKKNKKYHVSIAAIFKNEAQYLKEWIEYHLIIGVEHFFLYNNSSEDDYKDVLEKYINDGIVTLIDWPYKQAQIQAYEDCIKNYSMDTKWIGFVDVDEFIVPKKYDNIYEFLRRFNNRGSVLVYWKMFCSAGMLERDMETCIIEAFTVSWRRYYNVGKCFYNTDFEYLFDKRENSILHHLLFTTWNGLKIPPINCFGNFVFESGNSRAYMVDGTDFPIQINHYFTKSWKEYTDKMNKTDVYHEVNPHTVDYFFWHDMKSGAADYSAYKYLVKLKQALNTEEK